MQKAARLPTDFEAVAILAEKIKHPSLGSDALSRQLKKQRVFVDTGSIDILFAKHGLVVKKTPHSV